MFALVAAYDGEPQDPSVGFTISVYSPTQISWIKDTPINTFTKKVCDFARGFLLRLKQVDAD